MGSNFQDLHKHPHKAQNQSTHLIGPPIVKSWLQDSTNQKSPNTLHMDSKQTEIS